MTYAHVQIRQSNVHHLLFINMTLVEGVLTSESFAGNYAMILLNFHQSTTGSIIFTCLTNEFKKKYHIYGQIHLQSGVINRENS